MNTEMAYLLGMICGNGEIIRGTSETTISIDIPHKKLETEEFHDVRLYVKASLSDIRNVLEPLVGSGLSHIQNEHSTIISFSKPNSDYLIREILRYTGAATSHDNMRIHQDVLALRLMRRSSFCVALLMSRDMLEEATTLLSLINIGFILKYLIIGLW